MTVREKIIEYLQKHHEGIDDDQLAIKLNLPQRQEANARCRTLQKEGLVERRQIEGKLHNFWIGYSEMPSTKILVSAKSEFKTSRPWYWEGNVQSTVIRSLIKREYQILSFADTASHEKGIDIVAEKDGKQLWISAKGYPKNDHRTRPTIQASHWFKQVIFDMLEYRQRDKGVLLGVALPDYQRYRNLSAKIEWIKPVVGFSYYWVKEDSAVTIE